jgi:hypothetical protein
VNELNRERADRCLAAVASPSYSADRSSRSPFISCERVSRTQAAALRPGDQIAAPLGPGQAPVLSWSPVWSVNQVAAYQSIPFREEI